MAPAWQHLNVVGSSNTCIAPSIHPSCRSRHTPSQKQTCSLQQAHSHQQLQHQRSRRCHAVSGEQGQPQQQLVRQQDSLPLVERMFDHNWRSPLAGHDHPDASCRPVLALGKFDALHKGHQALAAAALQLGGTPVLLSFSGMAAVLGWGPRKPLVAPCDRPRVLHLWALQLAQQQLEQEQRQRERKARRQLRAATGAAGAASFPGAQHANAQQQQQQHQLQTQQQQHQQLLQPRVVPVRQRYIPFAAIRSLSPEAFVQHIVEDFRAAGVVSGGNYRFGYRAAGDAALLQQLCGQAGLPVAVVEMVGAATPGSVGPVSSTKIREMLDTCRMEAVKRSLGRPYRLVAEVNLLDWQQQQQQQLRGYGINSSNSNNGSQQQEAGSSLPLFLQPGSVFVPTHQLLNQHPAPGVYLCDVQLFVGASAHDDLLQLQQAVEQSGGSTNSSAIQTLRVSLSANGSSNRSRGGAACSHCIQAQQQEVEVLPDGLVLPQALWQAAESCLNNAVVSASRQASSTSSSSGGSGRPQSGTDPLVWDTDDREDYEDDADAANSGAGGSMGSMSSSSAAQSVSALLVLDIESCLRQMCELRP